MSKYEFLLDSNYVSPNNQYKYRIKKLESLNPSAIGCKIAFFNAKDELLYHRKNSYAHEIHSLEEIDAKYAGTSPDYNFDTRHISFVKWSKEGNVAYFCEYHAYRSSSSYYETILDLNNNQSYKIPINENNSKPILQLVFSEEFTESNIFRFLNSNVIPSTEMIKDPFHTNWFQSLFSKWT